MQEEVFADLDPDTHLSHDIALVAIWPSVCVYVMGGVSWSSEITFDWMSV